MAFMCSHHDPESHDPQRRSQVMASHETIVGLLSFLSSSLHVSTIPLAELKCLLTSTVLHPFQIQMLNFVGTVRT